MELVRAPERDDLRQSGDHGQVAPFVADDRRLVGQAPAVLGRLLLGDAPPLVQEHGHYHLVLVALFEQVHVNYRLLLNHGADGVVAVGGHAADALVIEDGERFLER